MSPESGGRKCRGRPQGVSRRKSSQHAHFWYALAASAARRSRLSRCKARHRLLRVKTYNHGESTVHVSWRLLILSGRHGPHPLKDRRTRFVHEAQQQDFHFFCIEVIVIGNHTRQTPFAKVRPLQRLMRLLIHSFFFLATRSPLSFVFCLLSSSGRRTPTAAGRQQGVQKKRRSRVASIYNM